MSSPNVFHEKGYQLLPSVVPSRIVDSLLEHALTLSHKPELAAGDSQVPGTPAVYGDTRMDTLLATLTPIVEAKAGVSVYPTYSYFRVYKKGDVLKKHRDRPSCEISLSLSLGYDPDEPWPLWIDSGAGATAIPMKKGDAVLYKGCDVLHWREEFKGNYAAQVFLHYVDQQGPHREWRFDKREVAQNQTSAK
jgi:hypothetical protein